MCIRDSPFTVGGGIHELGDVDRLLHAGADNLSLIPGEVGASAVQNIGAYGVEVKDLITCLLYTSNLVGMSNKGYKLPNELSGGEQQRIVIARAVLNSPEIKIGRAHV